MTYRFHRCQPHAKCPDLAAWYLELAPGDAEIVANVHRGVTTAFYLKSKENPHLQADETQKALHNPVKLAAGWLQTVERFLAAGESVLVNGNGGVMPREGATILKTVESATLTWPGHTDDEEIITISRWREGRHYVLCSSTGRVFVPGKYCTYQAAHNAAARYVPVSRIKSKC